MIISKRTSLIQKINNFQFNKYILSFYKDGYLLYSGSPKAKTTYDRIAFVENKRKNKRITIQPSKFDIKANDFTNSLFIEHLLQSDHYLVRFIFLYQIIEYFIDELSEKQYSEHVENYKAKKISKNDFRESINTSATERKLINDVFELTTVQKELKDEFITDIDFLFKDIDKISDKKSFPDKIYNLRNLVTHNLRELTTKSDSLKKITEIFERIIVDLLINYKTKVEERENLNDKFA
ncbi:HEPN domain-containing protein [Runella zeae]|uniref:HEPN domain-containing protein n=1 Tax=Runella zeae TaxID=94255 RepID=UPI0003F74C24|nr:HEPN domain-containing protein [Runella zeae]